MRKVQHVKNKDIFFKIIQYFLYSSLCTSRIKYYAEQDNDYEH